MYRFRIVHSGSSDLAPDWLVDYFGPLVDILAVSVVDRCLDLAELLETEEYLAVDKMLVDYLVMPE